MRCTHATLVWLLIAAMSVVTAVSLLAAGMGIDLKINPSTYLAIAALFVAGRLYPSPQVKDVVTAVGQMLLILLLGELLTYPAATANFPYRDALFYRIDQALGFDRQAYLQFFHTRPWLDAVTGYAYLSLLPQFAFLPLLLNNQMPRLRTMMIATGIALLVTIAISAFIPAVDAFIYVDVGPAGFSTLPAHNHAAVLEALRSGALRTIRLDCPEGLITFPSFHTAGALLFIWALWKTPYVRWLALGLNVALLAATPVFGEHYLIDVIAGAAVAVVSILVSEWLRHWIVTSSPPTTAMVAEPTPLWRRISLGLSWLRQARS
jgi:hypothetical protein